MSAQAIWGRLRHRFAFASLTREAEPLYICPLCLQVPTGNWKHLDQSHFCCPACGAVSYNYNDLRYGWCGKCHRQTAEPKPA